MGEDDVGGVCSTLREMRNMSTWNILDGKRAEEIM
jgi:hypothetical protein